MIGVVSATCQSVTKAVVCEMLGVSDGAIAALAAEHQWELTGDVVVFPASARRQIPVAKATEMVSSERTS